MSQIIKTYVGIFMLMLITFASIAIIQMHLSVVKAQDFHAAIVTELSNSHFSPAVISGCEKQAQQSGYDLQLQPYSEEINGQKNVYLMEVILQYPFQMGMFQIDSKQQIRGYAR